MQQSNENVYTALHEVCTLLCTTSVRPHWSNACEYAAAVHRLLSSPPADYDTWPEWSREKLDQNIPIDRKDGRGTQIRSVALHTFVNSIISSLLLYNSSVADSDKDLSLTKN